MIVENMFVFGSDSQFEAVEVYVVIDAFSGFAGGLALVATDMFFAEEELSVEVADFDIIIIGNVYLASLGGDAHECHHFDELAAKGSCSDHEGTRAGCG